MSDDNVVRFPGASLPGKETGKETGREPGKVAGKARAKSKARGNTLCRHGHHRWVVVTDNPFAVRTGRLVTHFACSRCDATKTELR